MKFGKIYPLEPISDKDLEQWLKLSKTIDKLHRNCVQYNWNEYFENARIINKPMKARAKVMKKHVDLDLWAERLSYEERLKIREFIFRLYTLSEDMKLERKSNAKK